MTRTVRRWSRRHGGFGIFVVLLFLASPVASSDSIAAKAELCASCHGDAGLPPRADIPIIWGQEFYYLYVQLKDYKAGLRHNPEMSGIVASLSKEEMRDLAQHFAAQKWPATGFAADESDIKRGETATAAGVCVQCHLGGYEGNSRVPRLAGQTVGYLERTMMEFKDKTRMNSPAKASLMESFDSADITAMARYLADF